MIRLLGFSGNLLSYLGKLDNLEKRIKKALHHQYSPDHGTSIVSEPPPGGKTLIISEVVPTQLTKDLSNCYAEALLWLKHPKTLAQEGRINIRL